MEDRAKLQELYRGWTIEDLKKAVTVNKGDYQPEAIAIINEELQSRSVTKVDLDSFHKKYTQEEECLKREGKLFCPKCHSTNIKKERPGWSFLIFGLGQFLIPKYRCDGCGYSFQGPKDEKR
jgi:hypothetical protein